MTKYIFGVVTIILTVSAILLLIYPVTYAGNKIFNNYNEGWNAFHAEAVHNGEFLYPDDTSLVVNNYPPGYFHLLSFSKYINDDLIINGRIISLISFLLCGFVISYIVFYLVKSFSISILSFSIFVNYFTIMNPAYISINDPQWPGHFLQLMALLLVIVFPNRKYPLIISSVLLVISGFIKHILIPLPATIAIYLALTRNRYLGSWLAYSVGLLILLFALCYFFYGNYFFDGIFQAPRGYSLKEGYWKIKNISHIYIPLLVPVFLFFLLYKVEQVKALLVLYCTISFVAGVIFIGAEGVVQNAIYDFHISLILITGIMLAYITHDDVIPFKRYMLTGALFLILLVPVISLPLNSSTMYKLSQVNYLSMYHDLTALNISIIRKYNDPVFCENPALCYWGEKKYILDYFNTGQRIRYGDKGQKILLLNKVRNKEINLIQIVNPSNIAKRLPNEFYTILDDNYEILTKNYYGIIYVPKAGQTLQ